MTLATNCRRLRVVLGFLLVCILNYPRLVVHGVVVAVLLAFEISIEEERASGKESEGETREPNGTSPNYNTTTSVLSASAKISGWIGSLFIAVAAAFTVSISVHRKQAAAFTKPTTVFCLTLDEVVAVVGSVTTTSS